MLAKMLMLLIEEEQKSLSRCRLQTPNFLGIDYGGVQTISEDTLHRGTVEHPSQRHLTYLLNNLAMTVELIAYRVEKFEVS